MFYHRSAVTLTSLLLSITLLLTLTCLICTHTPVLFFFNVQHLVQNRFGCCKLLRVIKSQTIPNHGPHVFGLCISSRLTVICDLSPLFYENKACILNINLQLSAWIRPVWSLQSSVDLSCMPVVLLSLYLLFVRCFILKYLSAFCFSCISRLSVFWLTSILVAGFTTRSVVFFSTNRNWKLNKV